MMRLTVLLLVRDVAGLLPAFLEHHRDLWDELVVVDTGSGDGSPGIAAAAPRTSVVTHRWRDDFAAARNAGLDRAGGDWVLVVDADERIAAGDFQRLRESVAASEPTVFLQTTINYLPDASHLEWQPLVGRYPFEEQGQSGFFAARRAGCFPRRADLRFAGRVHESVLPAAEAAGLAVTDLDVPVHHYGFALSRETNEKRRAAYRELVRRKLADDPTDSSAQLECATVYLEDGANEAAERLLVALAGQPPLRRAACRGRYLLGRLRREQGNMPEAGKLLSEACRHDPGFLFGWLEWIRMCASQESWGDVFDLLRRAEGACGDASPLLKREALRALVKTGRLDEARKLAAELADTCPHWTEIRNLSNRLSGVAGA